MLNKLLKKIILLSQIKFLFTMPKKNIFILYGDSYPLKFTNLIKYRFNVLKIKKKEIYFYILLKQLFFLDFKFSTYAKNYIKYVSPKIVVTFSEVRISFYQMKKNFPDIKFISIASVIRSKIIFDSLKKHKKEKLYCDYMFVINKYYASKYKEIINAKYFLLGNITNNSVKIKKTIFQNKFLFISQYSEEMDNKKNHLELLYSLKKCLCALNLYFNKNKKKIHILLRGRKTNILSEINFYQKIFQNNCIFHSPNIIEKKYELLDKFENIIFLYSTMGYEAISRKKKVAIFLPKFMSSQHWFGWPKKYQKNYNFFASQKISFFEINRVLNNISNCSQKKWETKYFKIIKDQFIFEKDNKKIKILFKNLGI